MDKITKQELIKKMKLSEEDLEKIAGGTDTVITLDVCNPCNSWKTRLGDCRSEPAYCYYCGKLMVSYLL